MNASVSLIPHSTPCAPHDLDQVDGGIIPLIVLGFVAGYGTGWVIDYAIHG